MAKKPTHEELRVHDNQLGKYTKDVFRLYRELKTNYSEEAIGGMINKQKGLLK
jgi:hypothetical protein